MTLDFTELNHIGKGFQSFILLILWSLTQRVTESPLEISSTEWWESENMFFDLF